MKALKNEHNGLQETNRVQYSSVDRRWVIRPPRGGGIEGHTDFNYRNRLLSKVDRYPTIEVPGRRIVVIKTVSEKCSSEEMESVSE